MDKLAGLFQIIVLIIFSSSCSLFNSGSVNIKYNSATAEFNDVTYENINRLSDVSFSVRNVQHPKSRKPWNVNLSIRPAVHFDKNTYGTLETHINDLGQEVILPNVKVSRFMGLGDLRLTLHTPAGQFVFTGGYGGTWTKLEDGQGLDSWRWREIAKLDLQYIAFMSKRFFFLIGPRYYKEKYESTSFALRLGYFWGHASK